MVGAVHEFGSRKRNIPQRSSIQSSIFINQGYKAYTRKLAKGIMNGKITLKTGLEMLGQTASQDIQMNIRNISNPANTKATIKAKGSSNPLIDTGMLINSISYNVKG